MRELNKDIEKQASNKKNQRYQTHLFDFLNDEETTDTQNIKGLQKISNNQQIEEKFSEFLKILNANNTNWIASDNYKYFISSDKHMIITDLINY